MLSAKELGKGYRAGIWTIEIGHRERVSAQASGTAVSENHIQTFLPILIINIVLRLGR